METSRVKRPSYMKRPAVIPNMVNNAGNRALSSQLWTALWLNYNRHESIHKIAELAQMFLDSHPQRFNCISETLRHFNLVIGINAQDELDYHQTIEDYFETGNGTVDNNDFTQAEVTKKTQDEPRKDIRPIKQGQGSTPVNDTLTSPTAPF